MATNPNFARGVAKTVCITAEQVFGSLGAGPGQLLRRTSSDLNLNTQQIQSQEILPSQQVRDSRQGPRQVQGTIAGQLSPGTYAMIFEAMLRGTLAPGVAFQNVSGSCSQDPSGVVTLNYNSVDLQGAGLRVGDVVRLINNPGASAIDNGVNMVVVGFTGGLLQCLPPAGFQLATWSSQVDTMLCVGYKCFTPATGQVDRSFTFEHWYSDIGQSELFLGCKPTQLALNIPASGFATMQASFTGQQMQVNPGQIYPTANPATTAASVTATSGAVMYNGFPILYISGLNLQIASQVGADPVVGSNLIPQIFLGTLNVNGSFTALTAADGITNDFLLEKEVSLDVLMQNSPSPTADFIKITVPRVKLTSSTKNDSDRAITRSFNFIGLENTNINNGRDLTSISYQDSLAT